jgi:hypothetical protein
MARGWESKSIEIQIEEAESGAGSDPKGGLSATEIEMRRKREDLLLQRSRILQEIASARNPRYRLMLEEKLTHLESQLYQFR